MPSRFTPAKRLILLPCIVYCASCAALPQTCVRCSLPCDGAPELETHGSVHVLVEQRSDTVLDQIHTVSSLCDGGRCSVLGCFQRDTRYSLRIYTNDEETVPKVLLDKTDVQPACGPDGISHRSSPDDADRNRSNKLLILLTFCLCMILFHPRD